MNKYLSKAVQRLVAIEATDMLHEDTVQSLCALLRQHIEANSLQHCYRTLWFYCNWSLHPRMDKGVVQDMLDDISQIISAIGRAAYNDQINEVLSISRLRADFQAVFRSAGVTSLLFDTHSGWKSFLSILLLILIDKPLERTRKASTAIYARDLRLYVPDYSQLHPDYVKAASIQDGAVFYAITAMPKTVIITGPLVLMERPDHFEIA